MHVIRTSRKIFHGDAREVLPRLTDAGLRGSVRLMYADPPGAEIRIPKVSFRPSYLSPGGKPKLVGNLWSSRLEDGVPSNENAHREQQVFAQPFAYAKPLGLLHRIIQLSTAPEDLVLDPFGGSGTTAQAARETGRSSILVEEQGHLIEQYVEPRGSVLSRIP